MVCPKKMRGNGAGENKNHTQKVDADKIIVRYN